MNSLTTLVVVALLAAGAGATINGWRLGTKLAEEQATTSKLRADLAERNERAAAAVGAARNTLDVDSSKDADHVRASLNSLASEYAQLRAASDGLRRRASVTSTCSSTGPGAPAVADGGAPAAVAELVPAQLYDRAEREALELGFELDAARAAGLSCERHADRYRAEALALAARLQSGRDATP